jgi:signal transduction histidine kinase
MHRVDQELIKETEDLSAKLSKAGIAHANAVIAEEAKEEDENAIFIRVISLDGEILASTNMSSWGNIDTTQNRLNAEEIQSKYVFQTLSFIGQEHKARVISAVIGPKIFLQYGMKLVEEEQYLRVFRNLFCILFLLLALFSGLVGWFIARQGLRDVEEVTQTAMEISDGSPHKRVKIKNHYEEIERLANAFNKMLDRIQTIHDAMREINDNIAHDLRSPLARIRGIAEMALIRKRSDADFENMAISTIEECDTLIDMINTMLEITEVEAGVWEQKNDEFDLAKLISDACEIFRPMADSKHLAINLNAPDTIIFCGDKKKVQRIVTNLLENAIKYTPNQGKITISALEHDGKIDIVVEDTGIGISQEDLPRIFERFYRSEKSRTTEGIGLGLSLAKAFVMAIGGAIAAKSTLGKGSTFVVSLPNQS